MAQKKTATKKWNLDIDEEKDFFLSSINKKLRNARKKIQTIEELEKKAKEGPLKPEQLEKIKGRTEVNETIKYHDTIRDLYLAAYKAAKDEGKLPQTLDSAKAAGSQTNVEEQKTTEAPQVQEEAPAVPEKQQPVVSEEERKAETARITRDVLSKVLNLVHVAQASRDQPEVNDLYSKIFTFSESDKFVKVSDKLDGALHELELYVSSADQPALRNKSYKHLQEVVENQAGTSSFRNAKADHGVRQAVPTHEPSAIGSELRKGQEPQHQEKLGVPAEADQLVPNVGGNQHQQQEHQEKRQSPQKETRAQVQPETTKPAEKRQEVEETKKDWGNIEDDEDEGDLEEEGQQEGEAGQTTTGDQNKEEDDGFRTVRAPKTKERKEDKPFRGGRGGGRGGRGGQGGYRGGYRGSRNEGEEGGQGGYRGGERRPPRTQEGAEGGQNETTEGGENRGYRGQGQSRGEGRGGRGGYRGQGRGEYRGGNRGEGQGGERREYGGYRGARQGGDNRGQGQNQGQTQSQNQGQTQGQTQPQGQDKQ